MRPLLACWLGRVPYTPALEMQSRLAARRAAAEIPDTLLLLEHDPVYTLGRRATEAEVLLDAGALAARGIEVHHTDRGGRATFHGPGQLVGYPIVDLGATSDLVGYVRALERAMIAAVGEFGVSATAVEGLTGIWAGSEKVGAIGVHVSRGITTHGFALNVSTDLSSFGGIVPCGLPDRGVASVESLTGRAPEVRSAGWAVARHVASALGRALAVVEPRSIGVEEVLPVGA